MAQHQAGAAAVIVLRTANALPFRLPPQLAANES
jgi:hypothetical protein